MGVGVGVGVGVGKGEIYIVMPYLIGYCTLYTRRVQTETGNP